MVSDTVDNRFPAGSGWLVGYAIAAVAGIVGWYLSNDVVTGLILLLATGPPLGVTLERSLETEPLTPKQRESAALLALAGVVVGAILLVVVLL